MDEAKYFPNLTIIFGIVDDTILTKRKDVNLLLRYKNSKNSWLFMPNYIYIYWGYIKL